MRKNIDYSQKLLQICENFRRKIENVLNAFFANGELSLSQAEPFSWDVDEPEQDDEGIPRCGRIPRGGYFHQHPAVL